MPVLGYTASHRRRCCGTPRHRAGPVPPYPSAEGRLPEEAYFAESDVIIGEVRVRSVHKGGNGHKFD